MGVEASSYFRHRVQDNPGLVTGFRLLLQSCFTWSKARTIEQASFGRVSQHWRMLHLLIGVQPYRVLPHAGHTHKSRRASKDNTGGACSVLSFFARLYLIFNQRRKSLPGLLPRAATLPASKLDFLAESQIRNENSP